MVPGAELDPVFLTSGSHLGLKKAVAVLLGSEEVQQQNSILLPGSKCMFRL